MKFDEWGRYVMTWHDGRFMRHTRFRYWLLDTSLRLMTPGMQRTFFRTREAANRPLEELHNKTVRKNLIQQMSTVTSGLPGSVGERRKMRHELEAMVQQIEAETADNDENGGAGRVPAGFCTLTCPVYKWQQLHETILKSYPDGPADDPSARQYYEQWQAVPPSLARDAGMKQAFYKLAVANPGHVEWYCSLKLSMAVQLTAELLTQAARQKTVRAPPPHHRTAAPPHHIAPRAPLARAPPTRAAPRTPQVCCRAYATTSRASLPRPAPTMPPLLRRCAAALCR